MTNSVHSPADSQSLNLKKPSRAERIFIGSSFGFLALGVTQPVADLYRACFFLGIFPAVIYLVFAERQWKLLIGDRLFVLVLALLIYFYASVFWSDPLTVDLATQYLRWFIETLAFATAAYLYGATRQFERLPHGVYLLWLVLAAVVISVSSYFFQQEFPQRLRGVGLLKLEILGSAVLIILWAVALMDPKVRTKRWWPLVLTSLLGVFLFVYLTQSRGPLLSLLILCALLILFLVRSLKLKLILTAAGAVILALCLYSEWGFSLLSQMLNRGDSHRLAIWQSVVTTMPDYWLFGLGIATEFAQSEAGAIAREATGMEILHPHNLWLATLFYGGILAVTLLMGLLAALLWRLRRLGPESAGAALSIIVTSVALCMTDTHQLLSNPREIWVIFWLPLMIVAGASAQSKDWG